MVVDGLLLTFYENLNAFICYSVKNHRILLSQNDFLLDIFVDMDQCNCKSLVINYNSSEYL